MKKSCFSTLDIQWNEKRWWKEKCCNFKVFVVYIWKIKLLPIWFSTIFGKIEMKFRVIAKKDKLEPLSPNLHLLSMRVSNFSLHIFQSKQSMTEGFCLKHGKGEERIERIVRGWKRGKKYRGSTLRQWRIKAEGSSNESNKIVLTSDIASLWREQPFRVASFFKSLRVCACVSVF